MFRGLSSVEALLGAALFAQVSFGQPGTGPVDPPSPEVVLVEEETVDPDDKARPRRAAAKE
jgi:hypothetical protein